jgi:hypothetical protein
MEGTNDVTTTDTSQSGGIFFYVPVLLSGGAAWLAAQVAVLVTVARAVLTFYFGSGIGEFIADPAHFPGFCMVAVALIQIAGRGVMWWMDNPLKREVEELRRQLDGAHKARGRRR